MTNTCHDKIIYSRTKRLSANEPSYLLDSTENTSSNSSPLVKVRIKILKKKNPKILQRR